MTIEGPDAAQTWRGLGYGLLGVAMFSVTLPATRIAVAHWDPVIIGLGRALVAAALAGIVLIVTRQARPHGKQWGLLAITSMGVIFGFPLLSAIAMQHVPAAHGGVVLGVLPLATAAGGVLFARERPSAGFWVLAALGSAAVVVFSLWDGGGSIHAADILLFVAVAAAGIGYAAGAVLARDMGGWQVICWALVISIPGLLPPVLWVLPALTLDVSWAVWGSFAYVAVFSQFVGFFAWYRGLALGGVAQVGQIQLLQPFMTILFAALLLGENLTWRTIGFASLVVLIVWGGRRMPVAIRPAER